MRALDNSVAACVYSSIKRIFSSHTMDHVLVLPAKPIWRLDVLRGLFRAVVNGCATSVVGYLELLTTALLRCACHPR